MCKFARTWIVIPLKIKGKLKDMVAQIKAAYVCVMC